MSASLSPRSIRPVPSPLGLYFRAGQNDHQTLTALLAQGHRSFHGLIVDAPRYERHQELISAAENARIESILDPVTAASATRGGYSKGHAKLPWGLDRPHCVADFTGSVGRDRLQRLAEYAIKRRFSQVIAPTHLITGVQDEWFAVDRENADAFRNLLDSMGGKSVGMIYQLSLPYRTLRDEAAREAIIDELHGIPATSLWLNVDGLGSGSTSSGVRNYVEGAREFSRLDLPIVADHFGGLPGLSLLAAGAVGGLATGLATGQRLDVAHWKKFPEGKPFAPHPDAYLSNIDFMLPPKEARALLESNMRLRAHYGCRDSECCFRGIDDMVSRPGRHFAIQRMKQVIDLGRHPPSARLGLFLDQVVRPTTDRALQFARAGALDEALRNRAMKHQQRLDSIRITLTKLAGLEVAQQASLIPETRAHREGGRPMAPRN